MSKRDLTIAIVGSGGDGVITMGNMIAQQAAAEGLHVIKVEAYGPQIRGGEASCSVRLSADPIYSQGDTADILVVFNWAAFSRFRGEILAAEDALILYEESDKTDLDNVYFGDDENTLLIPVPFIERATETAGSQLAKNILTLGMLAEIIGLPCEGLLKSLSSKYVKKPEVVEANRKAFFAGGDAARALDFELTSKRLEYEPGEPKLLISGNELCAVGAIQAGCRFFAGYPITPSSEILHFLSEWLPRTGGTLIQTEDELSAIGAVIGASFAGVKSMTSTSGPGLALMTEMLGLASITEIPVVIVDVQRGGPSTGLPTKNEQSDLWQALWGSHGDAPRVIIAPSDVEECFSATVNAFNIAEKYQIPVIVLSDQNIAQRSESMKMISHDAAVINRLLPNAEDLKDYARYRDTADGVSPMSCPGIEGGEYQTNGLEHDEYARPTSMHLKHEQMNAKRYRKLRQVRDEDQIFDSFGSQLAEVGILCWGSSKGPVREAVNRAVKKGERVSAFVPQMLYPFPLHHFKRYLRGVREIIVVELSYSAQFYKYLRTFLDLPEGHTHLYKRSGGKNLTVSEVERLIQKVLPLTAKREILL